MTHDEAERLAHALRNRSTPLTDMLTEQVDSLCDHILSGDMKREIENATYECGAVKLREVIVRPVHAPGRAYKAGFEQGMSQTVVACQRAIRALIQPPAQKENGE